MLHDGGYDFSFSGLKTPSFILYERTRTLASKTSCASFQEAAVDVLVGKTVRAAADLRVKTVSVFGWGFD